MTKRQRDALILLGLGAMAVYLLVPKATAAPTQRSTMASPAASNGGGCGCGGSDSTSSTVTFTQTPTSQAAPIAAACSSPNFLNDALVMAGYSVKTATGYQPRPGVTGDQINAFANQLRSVYPTWCGWA